MSVTGFVTAGGRSSRMGRDKAWLKLGGRAMIERVIDALAPVACSVAVIANSPEYARLGLPVFADRAQGAGPMEAIRTALENSATRRVILAGCDMPFLTAELFNFLIGASGDFQAVVPLSEGGKLEPLCALYSTEALDEVNRLIASDRRKVSHLFDRIRTRLVRFDEVRGLRGAELFFFNVNTPEDYARAEQLASRSG